MRAHKPQNFHQLHITVMNYHELAVHTLDGGCCYCDCCWSENCRNLPWKFRVARHFRSGGPCFSHTDGRVSARAVDTRRACTTSGPVGSLPGEKPPKQAQFPVWRTYFRSERRSRMRDRRHPSSSFQWHLVCRNRSGRSRVTCKVAAQYRVTLPVQRPLLLAHRWTRLRAGRRYPSRLHHFGTRRLAPRRKTAETSKISGLADPLPVGAAVTHARSTPSIKLVPCKKVIQDFIWTLKKPTPF